MPCAIASSSRVRLCRLASRLGGRDSVDVGDPLGSLFDTEVFVKIRKLSCGTTCFGALCKEENSTVGGEKGVERTSGGWKEARAAREAIL